MTARELVEILHPKHAWHTVTYAPTPLLVNCDCGEQLILKVDLDRDIDRITIGKALRNIPSPNQKRTFGVL